jgi:hypothetical protein
VIGTNCDVFVIVRFIVGFLNAQQVIIAYNSYHLTLAMSKKKLSKVIILGDSA